MFKPLLALCLQRPHLPQPEDSQYRIQRMEKQIPPFWWGLRYKTLWVCFFFFSCELPQRLITNPTLVGYYEAHIK